MRKQDLTKAILEWTEKLSKKHKPLIMVMSAAVVFVMTYMLIMPALTLDEDEAAAQGGIDMSAAEQVEDKTVTDEVAASDNSKEQTPVFRAGVLTKESRDYDVSVRYSKKAKVPEDTKLDVTELTAVHKDYEEYRELALAALQEKLGEKNAQKLDQTFLYDITLLASDQEIQPAEDVELVIDYEKAPEIAEKSTLRVVHYTVNEKNGEINAELLDEKDATFETKENKLQKVTIQAEQFSVYAVVSAAPEETEEIAQDEKDAASKTQAETDSFATGTLKADGNGYTVSVKADENAKLPEGTELKVQRIGKKSAEYETYRNEAEEAVHENLGEANVSGFQFADFFDITFVKDGKEIEPAAPVTVTIAYDKKQDIEQAGQAQIVHLTKDAKGKIKAGVLSESDTNVNVKDEAFTKASFTADSFSVYAVMYTVDFEYNGYQYSLPGGEKIKLSELAELLGIIGSAPHEDKDAFLAAVTNVAFSDESLVKVKKSGLFGLGSDWVLESLQPFTSEETLTITMEGGREIVIRVTDAQSVSDDLRNFLTSVTVTGAELVNGQYVVKPGQRYGVTLTFKETADLQFDDENTLTYKLPPGVKIPENSESTLTIAVTSSGRTYEIPATVKVNTNGTVTVKFDDTDPNFPKLSSATNVSFRVNLDAEFTEKIDGKDWRDETDRDIIIDDDEKADVFVQKTGSFDETTGKFTYTIKVTAKGDAKNVNVKDVISGNALKFNNDVKVSGNSSSYTDHGATNGFDYTFESMKDGEVITITYSASVDFSKDTDKDGKITVDQTKNTVTVKPEDGDPHSSEYSREIDYKSTKKDGGKESGTTEDGDKILDWTIEYNSLALAAAGGDTIKDTISEASAAYMKYYGDGITVKVYDKSGKLVETRNVKYSDLTAYSDSSWTYTIPTSDTTPYKYVISYQTVVSMKDIDGKGTDVVVSNTANDSKSDHDVAPSDAASITKRVAEQTEQYVEWESVIHVPEKGLTTAVVTDTVPSVWAGHVTGENKTIYDEYIKNSLSITGLLDGETYTVNTDTTGKVIITFYKDGQTGLKANTGGHDITVKLRTKVDPDWLKKNYASPEDNNTRIHRNTIDINGKEAHADAQFVKPDIEKKGPANGDAGIEKWGDYKFLKYEVWITGASEEPLVISDTFNTELLKVADASLITGDKANYYMHMTISGGDYPGQANDGRTAVSYSDTADGIIITANTVPKKADGNYYRNYKIVYYLQLKDGVDLEDLAVENGGKYELVNKAKWGDHESEYTYTYEYDALDKELIKAATANDRHVKYKVTFNPQKGELNHGEDIIMTDTLNENLRLDYKSIQITTDPEGVEVPYSISDKKDDSGNSTGETVVTYIVPDATAITVTYDAMVIGNGKNIHYKNVVEANGKSKTIDRTTDIDLGGEGEGATADLDVVKVDGYDANKKLAGVEFKLYSEKDKDGDYYDLSPNKSGVYEMIVKTDENGVLDIDGNKIRIVFGVKYYLEEITPPDGYGTISFPYQFTLEDDMDNVDYPHYHYYFSDSLQIKNWPLEGLVVGKRVESQEESDYTKDFQFRVSILDENGDVKTSVNETYGDMTFVNGVAEFTLRDKEQAMAWSMPMGTKYKVEELDADGFTVTTTVGETTSDPTIGGASYTGQTNGEYDLVNFTNKRIVEKTKVTVKKEWEPAPGSGSVTVELHRYAKITQGTINLTLTDQNGDPVSGATFQLYKDGVAQEGTYTTNDSGKISVNGLEKGSYYLKQTAAPENYSMGDSAPQTDTLTVEDVTTAQKLNASLTNTKTKTTGSATITLTSAVDNSKISGAGFSLYQGETLIQSGTTDSNGQLTFDELAAGSYTVKQTSTNSDLKVADDQSFTINSTEDVALAFTNAEKPVVYQVHIRGDYLENGAYVPNWYKYYTKGTNVTVKIDLSKAGWTVTTGTHEVTVDGESKGSFTNDKSLEFTFTVDNNTTIAISNVGNSNGDNIWKYITFTPDSNASASDMTTASTASKAASKAAKLSAPRKAADNAVTDNDATPASAPEGYAEDTEFTPISYTLTDDDWTYTFPEQDKKDADGNLYYYYVIETAHTPADYWIKSYDGDPLSADGIITITNKYTPKTGELDIVKAVKAGSDATGKTFTFQVTLTPASGTSIDPSKLEVTGAGSANFTRDESSGVVTGTITISGTGAAKVTGIPDGTAYAVTETEIPDGWAQDGSVKISGGDANGTIDAGETETATATNYELTSIRGTKTWIDGKWIDGEEHSGIRPDNLEIKLYSKVKDDDDSAFKEVDADSYTIVWDKSKDNQNEWTYTISNLPKYNDDGAELEYQTKEKVPTNYVAMSGQFDGGYATGWVWSDENSFTNVQLTPLMVSKSWSTSSTNGIVAVLFQLIDGNQVIGEAVVTAPDWAATPFKDSTDTTKELLVPKYDAQAQGDPISYTVTEAGAWVGSYDPDNPETNFVEASKLNKYFVVPNSETISTDDPDLTVEFSNTAESTSVAVDKKWFQGTTDITSAMTNGSLKVTLSAEGWDGKDINGDDVTATVSLPNATGDKWSASWSNLPKYDASGKALEYKVTESEVKVGEDSLEPAETVTVNAKGKATINNTLPTTSVEVTKKWAGDTWPEDVSAVVVELKANPEVSITEEANGNDAQVTLTKPASGSTATATWTNLPVYDNTGAKITYTVEEISVIMDGVTYNSSSNKKLDEMFEITTSPASVGSDGKAEITNTKITGKIKVTKNVKLNGDDTDLLDKEFWVAVYSDAAATTKVAGPKKITTSGGTGSVEFTDLIPGTYYVYELTGENGEPVTGDSLDSGNHIYVVTTDNTGAVISKTSPEGTATITNNKTEKGSLTVDKTTLYNGKADTTVEGKTIKIGLYTDAGTTAVKDPQDPSKNYVKELTLSAEGKGEVTFSELDYGTYYAYELDDSGNPVTGTSATINDVEYTVSEEGTHVTLNHSSQTGTISITNSTEESGKLFVTKDIKVNGEDTVATEDIKFQVGLYEKVDGQWVPVKNSILDIPTTNKTATITVKKGETSGSVTFDGLEIGKTYRVYELDGNDTIANNAHYAEYTVTYGDDDGVAITRGDAEKTTTVTNNKETTSIKATKTWSSDVPEGTSVEVTIKATVPGDAEGETTDVTSHISEIGDATKTITGKTGTVIWDNLPKYYNGKEVTYTVSETKVTIGGEAKWPTSGGPETDPYLTETNVNGNETAFTNAYTDLYVQKRFTRDSMGIDNWLREYDGGTIYFKLWKDTGNGTGYYVDETGTENASKVFAVKYEDTIPSPGEYKEGEKTYIKPGDTLHYAMKFSNLPAGTYLVRECNETGTTILTADNAGYMTCTEMGGKLLVMKNVITSVTAAKHWNDKGNTISPHPDVTFILQQKIGDGDWTNVSEKTLSETNKGADYHEAGTTNANGDEMEYPFVEWDNLPVWDIDTNKAITYRTVEKNADSISGYTPDGTVTDHNVYGAEVGKHETFTNELQTLDIEVTKAWDPATVPSGTEITLTLTGGGITKSIKLNGKSDWPDTDKHDDWDPATWETYTAAGNTADAHESGAWHALWKDLPKYDSSGKLITYTITETSGLPNGYVVVYGGNNTKTQLDLTPAADSTKLEGTITNIKRVDLNILKVDKSDGETPLADAKFTIKKIVADNATITEDKSFTPVTVTTDEEGKASFTDLQAGYYEIEETQLPAGYVLADFSGKAYIKIDENGVTLLKAESGTAPNTWANLGTDEYLSYEATSATLTVGNTPGQELPSTGGMGTHMLTILGLMLMAGGGTGLLYRRRKQLN